MDNRIIAARINSMIRSGFIPEKLNESKVEFSADFNSEVERVRKLYS